MSIRVGVLILVVLFLSGYAWKDWFRALLGGIFLFAFLEHPDMPRTIAGVPGLNFWNLLFFNITLAWLSQRRAEGLEWDFPRSVRIGLICYVMIVTISFLRACLDPGPFCFESRSDMVVNYWVNPLKFLLPALMLYDGCRTNERTALALGAILSVYFLLAVQSVKAMGLHFDLSSGDALSDRAARVLVRDVGYHRVDLSMMLAGASWAMVAFSRYFKSFWVKMMLYGAAGVTLMGQAVTGGRTGYATWALIGLTLCVLKWRKYLPLIPISVAVVLIFVPAVRERMLQGFGTEDNGVTEQADAASVTSGRNRIWPYVIDEIKKSPLVGYGRIAMQRQGIADWVRSNLGEVFNHPHNAYLEFLLDNGILGFLCGMPIYWMLLRRCGSTFLNRDSMLVEAAGGVGLCLLMALLISGLGAQTFYPREGVVGMWASLGVALRMWVRCQSPYGEDYEAKDDENLESNETPPRAGW